MVLSMERSWERGSSGISYRSWLIEMNKDEQTNRFHVCMQLYHAKIGLSRSKQSPILARYIDFYLKIRILMNIKE